MDHQQCFLQNIGVSEMLPIYQAEKICRLVNLAAEINAESRPNIFSIFQSEDQPTIIAIKTKRYDLFVQSNRRVRTGLYVALKPHEVSCAGINLKPLERESE